MTLSTLSQTTCPQVYATIVAVAAALDISVYEVFVKLGLPKPLEEYQAVWDATPKKDQTDALKVTIMRLRRARVARVNAFLIIARGARRTMSWLPS